jgi:hypothetical protein
MRLTRRVFGTGLLGLGVGLGLGLGGRALAARPTATHLAEMLNGALASNPSAARFAVPTLTVTGDSGAIRMLAEVRLDWSPGMRMRRIAAEGATEEAAWRALVLGAVAEFDGVVPGFGRADLVA